MAHELAYEGLTLDPPVFLPLVSSLLTNRKPTLKRLPDCNPHPCLALLVTFINLSSPLYKPTCQLPTHATLMPCTGPRDKFCKVYREHYCLSLRKNLSVEVCLHNEGDFSWLSAGHYWFFFFASRHSFSLFVRIYLHNTEDQSSHIQQNHTNQGLSDLAIKNSCPFIPPWLSSDRLSLCQGSSPLLSLLKTSLRCDSG